MRGLSLTEQQVEQSRVERVFYFYDEPVLYSCFIDNFRYLVLLINLSASGHEWFYALLDDESYQQLLENSIDLFSVFKRSEVGFIYKVIIDQSNRYSSFIVQVENIPSADLPAEGVYLFDETSGNTANN